MTQPERDLRILLVDDEPFVLKMLGRQLANLGCKRVIPCERARDALARLEDSAVDLIFCDLDMPEIDGVEFVRHLVRARYAGALVLISGEDERILQAAEKLARAHRLRVLGALGKPVASAALAGLLDQLVVCEKTVPGPERRVYEPDELRLAIACGELVNHYQPLVEPATGRFAGVETLVRWRHPHDGLVYPDRFVALAEEHGLIDRLTEFVLAEALHQARRWLDAGLELRLSVNISMDSLAGLGFPDGVTGKLAETGIPPGNLVLEVTESRLMKNRLVSLDILTRLRLKRIGLSIDDFGTGHSSLVQLRDIPFDELKIDRNFVHGACRDPALRAIFEASLGMARQLGMRTVAEGVEDCDDWQYLRAAGCSLAQGYFIGRPMPAEGLPAWIESWEARRSELVAAPGTPRAS